MAPYICQPLPLITTQIEFKLESPPILPTINPRMEFTPEHLSLKRGRERGPATNRQLWLDNQPPVQHRRDQESHLMVRGLGERSAQPAKESNSGLSDLSESNAELSDSEVPLLPWLWWPEASNKIPKSPSEPGWPASGGLSLEDTLMKSHSWSKENLERFTVGAYLNPLPLANFSLSLCRRLCMQRCRRVLTWRWASDEECNHCHIHSRSYQEGWKGQKGGFTLSLNDNPSPTTIAELSKEGSCCSSC